MAKRSNPDFLNGVPELLILKLLQKESQMHGYKIVQSIKTETSSQLEFGEGCIYPILHRLEADGIVKSSRQAVEGRRRICYRLTRKGEKRLIATAMNWSQTARAIKLVLELPGAECVSPA